MVSKQTMITNPTGLHARPASVFAQKAKEFQSTITIKSLDKEDAKALDAKSVLMILSAGLGTGANIEITCDGADEQEALDALVELLASGCGE